MSKIGVAIIGCGWVADWHIADGIAQLPADYELVAACDKDVTRAKNFAERYNAKIHGADFEEIVRRDDVDVVVICTPPMLHFPMVIAALAAGKHVVCEKPFCASLAQLDEVAKAERLSKGRVMPIFQYRFGEGLARVRHVIRSGLAGRHYVSSLETAKRRGPDYYAVAWRGKFATELGGVLLTQAIHFHDLMNWLLGPAKEVSCFKTTRVNPIEVEDCAVVNMRLHDGSLVSSMATLGSMKETTRIRLCFENVTFEQYNPGVSRPLAVKRWEMVPANEAVAEQVNRVADEVPPQSAWFVRQYELFCSTIRSGAEPPVTLNDARVSLELITACFLSEKHGRSVTLPIDASTLEYNGWTQR